MSRTRLRFLVGCSLALGLVSKRLLKKITTKEKKITPNKQNLKKLYLGKWQFSDPNNELEYTIEITDNLNLKVNNTPFQVTIIALSQDKLILQDLYGYHLTFYYHLDGVTHFYDEANDQIYNLLPYKKTPKD